MTTPETKTIYFHIGTTKTGSTSIQKFLSANRDMLREKGFALYTGHEKDPAEKLRIVREFAGGVDVSFATKEPELWVQEFLERLQRRPEKNIILTEEVAWFTLIFPRKKEQFASFVSSLQAFADVKLIVYLRRQDDFLMSSYQECLKYGWISGRTCRQEMNKKNSRFMRFRDGLEWLVPFMGKENIIVRPFEKGQFVEGSLIQDFLSCIGLALTEEYELADQRSNLGLSPFLSEILRCISFFKHGENDYAELVQFAFDNSDRCLNRTRRHQYLSPVDRHKYMEQFEADNLWVATELLGRNNGVLFYDPLPLADEPWTENRLNPDEVKSFFDDSEFLTPALRKKMCKQVLSVCGGGKPLRLRIRDRTRVLLRKSLRRAGLRRWARRGAR